MVGVRKEAVTVERKARTEQPEGADLSEIKKPCGRKRRAEKEGMEKQEDSVGVETDTGPPDEAGKLPGITRERVLEELACIAFCRATDYVQVEDGKLIVQDTAGLPDRVARAVVGLKEGTRGVEIKLGDKLRALEILGRSVGLADPGGDTAGLPEIIDDIPDE